MKHLVVLLLLFISGPVWAQTVDQHPGVLEVTVGTSFSSVKKLFSEEVRDPETGEPYHKMLNVATTKYATVLGGTVEEIRVSVEEGNITQVTVIFTKKVKLSAVVDQAVIQYGPAPCGMAVGKKETGGCFWEGEKFRLGIQNVDTPYLAATFMESYE